MISADLESRIRRHFHADQWPIATIAAQLELHHSVVRRVLREDGVPPKAFPSRPTKADPFIPFILETLKKHPDLKASRIFEMVKERGYGGAPDHFRAVIARHRPRKPAEAFLRRPTLPGEEAQVDWGHFGHIEIDGARRPLVAFAMVLKWSRHAFVRFGLDMRTGAFLAHHQAAFEEFGGVPRVILYDNLKSAVIERIGDAIVFNKDLLAFTGHYRYEPRPCAPYRGNEKGSVERAIRDIRDSFWPARTWTDLADLNQQAAKWCLEVRGARRHPEDRTLTVMTAFAGEKPRLRELPSDRFPVEDQVDVAVQKTPYARFDSNDYSVPHTKVRRVVSVRASAETVRILDGMEEIARHPRCWGKGRQIEDARHIDALMAVKRAASEGRGMLPLYSAVPAARDFIAAVAERGGNIGGTVAKLSELFAEFGGGELAVAIVEALAADTLHASAVRQVLDRRRKEVGKAPPVGVTLPEDKRFRDVVVKPAALGAYDQLGRGGQSK